MFFEAMTFDFASILEDFQGKSIVDLHWNPMKILQNRSKIKNISSEKYFPGNIFFWNFVTNSEKYNSFISGVFCDQMQPRRGTPTRFHFIFKNWSKIDLFLFEHKIIGLGVPHPRCPRSQKTPEMKELGSVLTLPKFERPTPKTREDRSILLRCLFFVTKKRHLHVWTEPTL